MRREAEARDAGSASRGSALARHILGLALASGAVLACDAPPPQAWAPPAVQDPRVPALQQELARPFVVFSRAEMSIEQLDVSVDAPIQVGSRPSPATMVSSAPEVVSVQADGRLVAHREGAAHLRASTGGPELIVSVRLASFAETKAGEAEKPGGRPVGGLSVRPTRAKLHLGDVQAFEALSPAGPIPVSWSTSSEVIVAHLQDHVFQGTAPGAARICATAAGGRACAVVEVTP